MPYKVIMPPEVSRAIGSFGLDRAALLDLLNWLYPELEERADNHRHHRDPTNPEIHFWCEATVWDQGQPRGFRFVIDDARATGHLFIVAAEET